MTNSSRFSEYRRTYPSFLFHSYHYSVKADSIHIRYHFSIPGLAEFQPDWNISILNPSASASVNQETLDRLVFSLGLVELVSYWKITCSPNVSVNCGYLSESQTAWWKKLYRRGLGEFFYTNGLTVDDTFMNLTSAGTERGSQGRPADRPQENPGAGKVLIPIGGGKDSAVTLELLDGLAERYCYIINPRRATLDTVEASTVPPDRTIIARRTLDPNMLRLNQEGFLNGHTPFSALAAFSSVLAAYLNGIPFVALSNESSANESTVRGLDVNHQYSKSYEFESDFIRYERDSIGSGVHYFSLLRPLTELKIAQLFSRYRQYHRVFRSCNVGSKQDIWCGKCAKCLFVSIILSPFLSRDEMLEIFGHDLLDDMDLKELFDKLIGVVPEKPFECVGERQEVNAALQELLRQYARRGEELPALLAYYRDSCHAADADLHALCASFDENHHIPEIFLDRIRERMFDSPVTKG